MVACSQPFSSGAEEINWLSTKAHTIKFTEVLRLEECDPDHLTNNEYSVNFSLMVLLGHFLKIILLEQLMFTYLYFFPQASPTHIFHVTALVKISVALRLATSDYKKQKSTTKMSTCLNVRSAALI